MLTRLTAKRGAGGQRLALQGKIYEQIYSRAKLRFLESRSIDGNQESNLRSQTRMIHCESLHAFIPDIIQILYQQ